MCTYDIIGNSKNLLEARLSNFTIRYFNFRGTECASLEGILQSLKCPDWDTQKEVCMLVGKAAKKTGSVYNWHEEQVLYWKGETYTRSSLGYKNLVTEIYDAAYLDDTSYSDDLFKTGHHMLSHSIGSHNMTETVLTETEFMFQLYRLRSRAHDAVLTYIEDGLETFP